MGWWQRWPLPLKTWFPVDVLALLGGLPAPTRAPPVCFDVHGRDVVAGRTAAGPVSPTMRPSLVETRQPANPPLLQRYAYDLEAGIGPHVR